MHEGEEVCACVRVCVGVCVCVTSLPSNELLSAVLYIRAYQYSDNSALTCSPHFPIV